MSDFTTRPNRPMVTATDQSRSGGSGRKKGSSKGSSTLKEYFQPDYIALLAHQLLNPLSTISATAQSMIRRAGQMDEHDIRARAEKIKRAGARLTELIETIMEHTRAKAGVMALEARDFNLRSLVERVCRHQSEDNLSHPFQLDIAELPIHYKGDPMLLDQAIAIIVSNAVKYSPADSPITIAGEEAHDVISIAVKDQGIGILAEDLPHLAQPFYRGKNAQHMPGTGLGLSLARHILDLHGGALTVESREGQGTTVTITLPVAQAFIAGSGI